MFKRVLYFTAICAATVSLWGCEHAMIRHTESVQETVAKRGGVKVNIAASSRVNPDAKGRAHPVRLKVYQLTNKHSFVNASYHDLVTRDFLVLGDALVRSTEVVIKPGQSSKLALDQNIAGRYVGIVAMFNQPHGENWRVIGSANGDEIQIAIDGNRIYAQ